MQHVVHDAKPKYDDADEDYIPEYYDGNNGDDDDANDGGRDYDIDPSKEPADIDADDNDGKAIIINPDDPEHDSKIAVGTTD